MYIYISGRCLVFGTVGRTFKSKVKSRKSTNVIFVVNFVESPQSLRIWIIFLFLCPRYKPMLFISII